MYKSIFKSFYISPRDSLQDKGVLYPWVVYSFETVDNFCSLSVMLSRYISLPVEEILTELWTNPLSFLPLSKLDVFLCFFRLPSERHSNWTSYCFWTSSDLQSCNQFRSMQNHFRDLWLWEQGHILLCSCGSSLTLQNPQTRTSQTASSYLRNPFPDEQGPATEVYSIFNHSTPHRSSSYCTKAGRWNSVLQLRNQPSER